MDEQKYPDEMLRGIANEKFIFEDTVTAGLFMDFREAERIDEFRELSITWFDNDDALKVIQEQLRDDGVLQFSHGIAIVSREEIDKLMLKNKLIHSILSYERRPLDSNPYHGNLLLKRDSNKECKYMVASALALYCFQRIEEVQDPDIKK